MTLNISTDSDYADIRQSLLELLGSGDIAKLWWHFCYSNYSFSPKVDWILI